MQKLSEKYIPSFDGLLLLYRQYGPAAGIPVRANLCLIHGFGEHSDRYVHVCEAFTKLGFVVHTVDLRGHGYSGGGRADGKFDWILQDIGTLLQRADPNLPLFIYGHSMGGMSVLKYLQEHPQCRCDGAIIASPLLSLTKFVPWWKRQMLEYGTDLFGEFFISSGIDPCGLSGVHEEVTKVFHDRMSLPFMTVRFAKEMLGAADRTRSRPHLIHVPVLFVHGAQDAITDPNATIAFSKEVETDDVTLWVIEGGAHELHNDHLMSQTIAGMGKWLEDHVGACEVAIKEGKYHARPLHRTAAENTNKKISASPTKKAKKGPSENAIRLGYLLVALMWLTPASFFMLPMHAAYVLICVLVMNYDMSQYDMFMVLIFGAMHLFQVIPKLSSEAPNSLVNGGIANGAAAETNGKEYLSSAPPQYRAVDDLKDVGLTSTPSIEVEVELAGEPSVRDENFAVE